MEIVLDTNVLIAALRSPHGGSFALLEQIGSGRFEINLSVPLVLEYEATAKEHSRLAGLSARDVDDVIDYLCSVARHRKIHYLWRPVLRDPLDDMVLELAVAAEADIVTHNVRDFVGAERFGVTIYTPGEFLAKLRRERR